MLKKVNDVSASQFFEEIIAEKSQQLQGMAFDEQDLNFFIEERKQTTQSKHDFKNRRL